MITFPVDDPAALRLALLETDWGTTTINGLLTFRLCPMCQAAVPAEFSNTTETTPRLVHIDHHVVLAEALRRAL